MAVGTYDIFSLLHVLAFVYWLGADLGVLYAARYGADERLPIETRQTIGDIMAFIDLFPRLSVPLIGATGATLAYLSGSFRIEEIWLWVGWLAALVWISSNLFIYMNRANPERASGVVLFDTLWRIILLVAIAGVAVASLLGVGITSSISLGAKLLIFAMAIALSLVLRLLFRPYRPALRRIVEHGDNATDTAIMKKALASARPVVILIWLLTIAAAAIGLWKPF